MSAAAAPVEGSPESPGEQPASPRPPPAGGRRRRWLRVLIVVLLPLMLVVLVVGWVLGTQSGLHFALDLLDELAPGLLQVERAEGRFFGDLHLKRVEVKAPGLQVGVGSFDLRWSPLEVLTGTVRIRELAVRDLDLIVAPAEEEEDESGPMEVPRLVLPLSLELERVLVERLSIGEPGGAPPFRVDHAALVASWRGSELTLRELSVALPEPRLNASAEGKADLTGAYPLELALAWDLAQGPTLRLEGKGRLGGDLERLTLDHALTGSAEAGLEAVVERVLEGPSWEGTIDIVRVDLPAIQAGLPAVDLKGRLSTSGDLNDARVQGTLDVEAADAALPDFGHLNANLDLTWRGQVLDIATLELTEDKSGALLTADGQLDLGDPAGSFELEAVWEKLRWPLTGELIAEARQGKLDATGTFEAFRYAMSAEIWGQDFPEASLQLAGEGDQEGTRIEGLGVDTLDGRIEARGQVAWAPELSWDLGLTADSIDPGVQWPDFPARVGLELTSTGTLDAFEYKLDGSQEGPALPAATLKLVGAGDIQGTNFKELRLDTLGGHLAAKGQLEWDPALRWDAELVAEGIDPGKQWPEWPGRMGGRVTSAGTLEANGPHLSALVEALKGELRGYPVSADAKVRMQGIADIQVEQLLVSSGPTRVQAKGNVGDELDIEFDLSSPDLKSLMPDATGSIKAKGTASGPRMTPAVKLDLAADKVQVAGQGIDRLRGKVDVDLTRGGDMRIDLGGEGLVAGGMTFGSLRVEGEGDMASHRLSAGLQGEPLSLDLKAAGGMKEDQAYAGDLSGLEIRTKAFGNWRLQKAALVEVAWPRLGAGPLCVRDEQGSGGCVRFEQREAGSWDAELDMDRLAFDLLAPFIPKGLVLEGETRAKGRFQASGGVLSGKASLEVPKGILRSDQKGGPGVLDFSSTSLGVEAAGKGLRAKLAVPLAGLGNLDGEVSLAGWTLDAPARPNQPLGGRIRARIDDLSLISRLAPDVTDVTGNIDLDLGLSGTLAKPGLKGYAKLANGGLAVPFIGLRVSNAGLDARAAALDRIDYKGGLSLGKGRLDVSGQTRVGSSGLTTEIRLDGTKLKVADSKEYFALVSPDIKIGIDPEGTSITGEVKVPEARIRTRTIPEGTVSPSQDIVLASEAKEEDTSRYSTRIDLRLVLGKRVDIDAFGLSGKLQGELRALQEPGRDLLGDGQLRIIDGSYRLSTGGAWSAAIGKPLTIEQGLLVFAKTPINNPGLLLTAQREGGDVTAGLRVFGTLKEPKMTFFSASDPGMSQSEVSNYLVTGIPPRRKKEDPADRALSVGTYVAPKLFVEYDHSLGDEKDKIKLRYDLNDWIELQTETGGSRGADIFFKFER